MKVLVEGLDMRLNGHTQCEMREKIVSRSERRLANQVCNLSGNGLVHSNNGFSADESRGVMDLELYRRLKFDFVQESNRRKIEKVDEWLSMGDETIFIRTVTVQVSLEGRITRRPHSHNRSWGEKYRPRSGYVASSVDTPDGDEYWPADRLYDLSRIGFKRPASKEDWAALARLNASCPEPTLKSKMPSQLIEMGSKK